MAAHDPIQEFLDAGVGIRTLIAHGSITLDWLAKQDPKKLRICAKNSDGNWRAIRVSPSELLKFGESEGWTPSPSSSVQYPVLGFDDTSMYCDDRGNYWYTSEVDEESGSPLCFTPKAIERLRQRVRKSVAAYERRVQAEQKAMAREKKRTKRQALAEALLLAGQKDVERSVAAGKPITLQTALRRERRRFADFSRRYTQRHGARGEEKRHG